MSTFHLLVFGMGGQEWIWILVLVLLLFGGKKIPEVAKGIGEGIKNFKHAMKEQEETPAATAATAEPKKPA